MPGTKPRLADMFVTNADRGPPPKRIAPRRGDPSLSAQAVERIAAAHDSNIAKGNTMPKYQMALDAAPQDGRWLDDPNAVSTVLQFLISKLPPDQLAELDDHLTKGTTPQATDHRLPEGKLKAELLLSTPRNRRAVLDSIGDVRRASGHMTMDEVLRADPMHGKSLDERFPNLSRLKGGY